MPRSVMQKVKDRTRDVDAAIDAQTGAGRRDPVSSFQTAHAFPGAKQGTSGVGASGSRATIGKTAVAGPAKPLRARTPIKKRR